MRAAVWGLGLALSLGMAAAVAAAGQPTLALRDGWLRLEGVPEILAEEEVRRQLDSGLTTSFVFQVRALDGRGGAVKGAVQVEVRFEPWDAVYFVTTLSPDPGHPDAVRRRSSRLESFEALRSWWHQPELPVLEATALERGEGAWEVVVEVRMIPFSATEQEDARRWFTRSLETPGGAAEAVGKASDEQTESLGRVMRLLMATSIQRRALTRHRWTVSFEP